jgi:hypothetical protein
MYAFYIQQMSHLHSRRCKCQIKHLLTRNGLQCIPPVARKIRKFCVLTEKFHRLTLTFFSKMLTLSFRFAQIIYFVHFPWAFGPSGSILAVPASLSGHQSNVRMSPPVIGLIWSYCKSPKFIWALFAQLY